MTREDYEDRKRRLDEQLRAGIELLEAAHRQQVRALDLVWIATTEEPVAFPRPPAEALSRPQAQPAAALTAALTPAPAAPPRKPRRRAAWELQNEVESALAQVPDVFDRNDICRALGYEPDRATLFRAVERLKEDGLAVVEQSGSGRVPTRYRKAGPKPAQGDA
jgi:hypothetical protein